MYASFANATTRVVVLDTGLNLADPRFSQVLCKDGHMDFTGRGIEDTNGHGTHVAGLIKTYAKDANYCLIIVKYYTDRSALANYLPALEYAVSLHPDFINISGGGPGWDDREYAAVCEAKANHTKFVVAAGNDNSIDNTDYYPAGYREDNIVVVGALESDGYNRARYSNYGSVVTAWEIGQVTSTLPNGEGMMKGTSQATAIHMGKMLNKKGTRQ